MESLHDVASFMQIPVIGCPAAQVGMNGPIASYDVLVRISFTHINLVHTIIRFFRLQKYTNVFLLVDHSHNFHAEIGEVMESLLRTSASDIWHNSKKQLFWHRDVDENFIRKTLSSAIHFTRGNIPTLLQS